MSKHLFVKLSVVLLVFVAFVAQGVQATPNTFQSPPPPPPPNDNFANAIVLPNSFSQYVDVTSATVEPGEPLGTCDYYYSIRNTVWHKFTAPSNGYFNTYVYSYNGDTALNVYQVVGSEDFSGLSRIGCVTFSGNVNLHVQNGVTYYFQTGNMWSTSNTIYFSFQFYPAPANDDFANAKLITTALPYDDSTDMSAAGRETNEPIPSCGNADKTVWYAYTPAASGSLSARTSIYYWSVLAVYTGDSLQTLSEVSCRQWYYYDSSLQTFHVDAGKTYYFQAATNDTGSMTFHLEVAPPPVASFYPNPSDPSMFDTVNFNNYSYDPANIGIQSQAWDFGDGGASTEWSPSHRYAADGDYNVKLTVNTSDGRTASTSQVVHVKTHDVTITKFTVPQSASSGQTRQLVVGLNSKRYEEVVEVQLFKSVPGGWQWVGALQQTVPVRPSNRTTEFTFNYTFTKDDAKIGKVTFRAVANIMNARDALPADNEAIALPTKVTR